MRQPNAYDYALWFQGNRDGAAWYAGREYLSKDAAGRRHIREWLRSCFCGRARMCSQEAGRRIRAAIRAQARSEGPAKAARRAVET